MNKSLSAMSYLFWKTFGCTVHNNIESTETGFQFSPQDTPSADDIENDLKASCALNKHSLVEINFHQPYT